MGRSAAVITLLAAILALSVGWTIGYRMKPTPPPVPGCPCRDEAALSLNNACCERWWTALGTDHDPECTNQKRRRSAA
jgi:hypothetical protein